MAELEILQLLKSKIKGKTGIFSRLITFFLIEENWIEDKAFLKMTIVRYRQK